MHGCSCVVSFFLCPSCFLLGVSPAGSVPWRRSASWGRLESGIGFGLLKTTQDHLRDRRGIVLGYGYFLGIVLIGYVLSQNRFYRLGLVMVAISSSGRSSLGIILGSSGV